MRWILPVVALAVLVACNDEPTEEENAAKIAAVEANQIPDPIPATPEALEETLLETQPAGCTFINGKSGAAIAFAGKDAGYMKLDGKMERFAPDVGSPQTDVGLPSEYDGSSASFTILLQTNEEKNGRPVGLLTLTDGYGRSIYQKEGSVACEGVGSEAG